MIYPEVVISMGITLVLYTIVETMVDQTHVWKNSSLALVYHGLQSVDEGPRLQTIDMQSMEERAKRLSYGLKEQG